jgi:opacity protein-like surface antigen
MKSSKPFFLLLLLLLSCSVCYSQSFTTGISSGINFSDIHGQDIGGKWISKPGPSEGLSFGYSFNKSFGIQTGIGFSAVNYEHKTLFPYYPYMYYNLSNSYISYPLIAPNYYTGATLMDFNFFRIPLLFTISIPASVQFNMRAGILFSFVQTHNSTPGYYYQNNADDFKKNDFGYLFSSGISYPVNDRLKLSVNFNYITGRKKFQDNSTMCHGSSEIMMGVDYSFLKNRKQEINLKSESDSSSKRVTVTYSAGLNYSWNSYNSGTQKYSPFYGPSLGFSLNFPLGHDVFFVTGVSFERKGYALKDSSTSFYRYLDTGNQMYRIDTKVITDYAVVPFLIRLPLGKFPGLFFSTGPWIGLKLNARTVGVAYSESHLGSVYKTTKNVVYDDITKVISNNDIGWLFGGGVSLPVFNKYMIDLSAQFSAGFKDIFDKNSLSDIQATSSDYQKMSLRTMTLRIGITFPSAKR